MRDIDEKVVKENLAKDPRRDPTDPPPSIESKDPSPPPSVPEQEPEPTAPNGESTAPSERDPVEDPRLAELETLVSTANWEAIIGVLGPVEKANELPPNLGLLYALAHKEINLDQQPKAKPKPKEPSQPEYDPNMVAIRSMASLFGVPEESPIALVLGKRIIRSNPVSWQKKKAPPAHISVLIVALGLLIGAAIGWMLSFGSITFRLPPLP